MIEVSATFPSNFDLAGVVQSLAGAGVQSSRVAVMTREPLELEIPRSAAHVPMSIYAIAGAVIGFIFAVSLIWFTAYDYRLPTGGMPLVPVLSTGVPTYELTLLGSVIATLLTLIITTGLARRRGVVEHPELDSGNAVVSVSCVSREECERARGVLQSAAREFERGAR